jgi:hypothetical protein
MADNVIVPNDPKLGQATDMSLMDTDKAPTFFMGEDRMSVTNSSQIVICAIAVNLDINSEDRKFSSTRFLHEIPLMRKLYGVGDIVIRPDWARSLTRVKAFTKEQALQHLQELGDAYVIRKENQTVSIVERVYGTGQELKLFKRMADMFTAYEALIARYKRELMPALNAQALAEFKRREDRFFPRPRKTATVRDWEFDIAFNDTVTAKDFEAIISLAEPQNGMFDGIDFEGLQPPSAEPMPASGVDDDAATAAGVQVDGFVSTSPDSLDDLTDSSEMVDHLKRCGFSNEIGLDVSVLYDTHGMNIPDAALTNLEGIGTSKKQLNLVKEAIKGFRAPAGAKR